MTDENQTNLDAPGVASALTKRISEDLEDFCVEKWGDGFRWHLGGSVIGGECLRKIWYDYRWVQEPVFSGRMHRLFQRGHLEEFRFVEYLRGMGWTVLDYSERLIYHDGSDSYTCVNWFDDFGVECDDVSEDRAHIMRAEARGQAPKQWRVSALSGHFGGSLDGIAIAPERYGLPANFGFLLEFKTQGTGKPFQDLKEKGVQLKKTQHFAQMCVYGSDDAFQLTHGLYMNTCKNDDDIHLEIVKLDWTHGHEMRHRAAKVVQSQTPPERLSDNPTFYKCKYCDLAEICHNSAPCAKNCRSCKFAEPHPSGEWYCNKHEKILERELVKIGCDDWSTVNAL